MELNCGMSGDRQYARGAHSLRRCYGYGFRLASLRPLQEGSAIAAQPSHRRDPKLSLALAVVACSAAPLLLVDGDFTVIAASTSFCTAFHLPSAIVINRPIFQFATGD